MEKAGASWLQKSSDINSNLNTLLDDTELENGDFDQFEGRHKSDYDFEKYSTKINYNKIDSATLKRGEVLEK